MKNLKMRMRMLVSFGILLVVIVIMNAFALANLRHMSNTISEMYNGPHISAMASTALVKEFYQMDSALKGMIINRDQELDSYQKARTALDQEIALISQDPNYNAQQLTAFKTAVSAYDAQASQVQASLAKNDYAGAAELMSGDFRQSMKSAVQLAEQMAQTAHQNAEDFKNNAESTANMVIIIQDILFAAIVVTSLVIALRLSRFIALPLKQLEGNMYQIAHGSFDVHFDNYGRNEMGSLANQLQVTVNNIREYISDITNVLGSVAQGDISIEVEREYLGEFSQIKTALNMIVDYLDRTVSKIGAFSHEVRTSANSLSGSAQSLSQGAVRQANALEEFQASLGRVTQLTEQDSENADKINHISDMAVKAVTESSGQMDKMLSAIEEINRSSEDIAKVIKLIEDIAFQTNILALNAAVEAARAGAAGKGFAVVADEVRNLASKSADAAGSTTAMIEKSVNAVRNGIEIAQATSQSMQEVSKHVGAMGGCVSSINESTLEQGRAFEAMMEAISQITSVVESNSAAAEENSTAAQQLSDQAGLLDEFISTFRLKSHPYPSAAPAGAPMELAPSYADEY